MIKYFLSWVLLCWASAAISQTITITNQENKKPLEWVSIASQHPYAFTTTNARGQADLTEFEGSEVIEIRFLGFKTLRLSWQALIAANFELALQPGNISLDEVVVSATRWEQSNWRQPAKITSLRTEAIQLNNPQTAADLLQLSGKVFIQKSQQGGGSPMIRGFATNRLIYTVDGVRMNTAIFRAGNIQNVINVDPFALERTEVLFGPGSVIYGSDAIGGVMSFQTLIPELSLDENEPFIFGKGITRFSSANQEKTGHFDVNVGWKKWALVTSFSHWDFDHLKQGRFGPADYVKPYYVQRIDGTDRVIEQDDELLQIPTGYSQTNLMQKIRFKPNQFWDVQYGFHFSETSDYGRYDRHNRVRNGLPRHAEWNYGPQLWVMNNLSILHQKKTMLYDKLNLRVAHQRFEESRIDRNFNAVDRTIQSELVDAYSANLDLVKSMSNHTLFYGVEGIVNQVSSQGKVVDISTNITNAINARYPEAKWFSAAVYANDQWSVAEKLQIQTGVRWNTFGLDANFDTTLFALPFNEANLQNQALTGSLGAVYKPTDKWLLSVNAGTAFRAPNVDDIGKIFDSEPGAVTVPNPNLTAEYAYNLDLGAAKVFGDWLKLELTAYYTILNNALVRRNTTLNGEDSIMYGGILSQVQSLQNAANATVYGIQAGAEMRLAKGLVFENHFNYQFGEEELDNGQISPSRHAAPIFGLSRLRYENQQLQLEVNVQYQGSRTFDQLAIEERAKTEIYATTTAGNAYVPAWYTLNLRSMYAATDQINLTAGIENITDQRYRPYSSGISGAGRNFVFSVQFSF